MSSDCTRKGYAASVALVPRERLRYHGAERLEMTGWGVTAAARRVVAPYGADGECLQEIATARGASQ